MGIRSVAFLNLRVAHEIKGCADKVLPFLYENGRFVSTLILSPPGCGKTTLLRDLIRQVSDGSRDHVTGEAFSGVTVGVADERSELGACYQGIPQNDLGMQYGCVRQGALKVKGCLCLIRFHGSGCGCCSEDGGKEDIQAVEYVQNCGCVLAATAHGASLEEVRERPGFRELLAEKTFKRLVFLSSRREQRGMVEAIYDGEFRQIFL